MHCSGVSKKLMSFSSSCLQNSGELAFWSGKLQLLSCFRPLKLQYNVPAEMYLKSINGVHKHKPCNYDFTIVKLDHVKIVWEHCSLINQHCYRYTFKFAFTFVWDPITMKVCTSRCVRMLVYTPVYTAIYSYIWGSEGFWTLVVGSVQFHLLTVGLIYQAFSCQCSLKPNWTEVSFAHVEHKVQIVFLTQLICI